MDLTWFVAAVGLKCHGVDHQFDELHRVDQDELKRICPICRDRGKVAGGVVAQLEPDRGVVVGTLDVFVCDS